MVRLTLLALISFTVHLDVRAQGYNKIYNNQSGVTKVKQGVYYGLTDSHGNEILAAEYEKMKPF